MAEREEGSEILVKLEDGSPVNVCTACHQVHADCFCC